VVTDEKSCRKAAFLFSKWGAAGMTAAIVSQIHVDFVASNLSIFQNAITASHTIPASI
jgi:hypothetical protein